MSAKIPETVADLFAGKAVAHLATVGSKGQPVVSPVWVDREGDRVLVNSVKGRVKAGHMSKGARVALDIVDPANAFRYVGVQGQVVEVRGPEIADKHIDKLSQRYLGKPYPFKRPGDQRMVFVIEPSNVKVQG